MIISRSIYVAANGMISSIAKFGLEIEPSSLTHCFNTEHNVLAASYLTFSLFRLAWDSGNIGHGKSIHQTINSLWTRQACSFPVFFFFFFLFLKFGIPLFVRQIFENVCLSLLQSVNMPGEIAWDPTLFVYYYRPHLLLADLLWANLYETNMHGHRMDCLEILGLVIIVPRLERAANSKKKKNLDKLKS